MLLSRLDPTEVGVGEALLISANRSDGAEPEPSCCELISILLVGQIHLVFSGYLNVLSKQVHRLRSTTDQIKGLQSVFNPMSKTHEVISPIFSQSLIWDLCLFGKKFKFSV